MRRNIGCWIVYSAIREFRNPKYQIFTISIKLEFICHFNSMFYHSVLSVWFIYCDFCCMETILYIIFDLSFKTFSIFVHDISIRRIIFEFLLLFSNKGFKYKNRVVVRWMWIIGYWLVVSVKISINIYFHCELSKLVAMVIGDVYTSNFAFIKFEYKHWNRKFPFSGKL